MDVRFIATTSRKLSELSIVSGQLIYLDDVNATYYDMGGTRRLMSSMRVVSSLPSTSVAQEGVLYGVVNAAGHVDASVWDSSAGQYRSLSGYAATTTSLGLVQPDGTTITIDANGVISCHAEVTSLPATSVTYDNTTSGLTATDAQAAIDEVSTISTGAAASASSAVTQAQQAAVSAAGAATTAEAAQQNAANASTAAQAAADSAAQAQIIANGASTAAAQAQAAVAAQSTAISDIETRLQAVEAVARIALTVEDLNVSSLNV